MKRENLQYIVYIVYINNILAYNYKLRYHEIAYELRTVEYVAASLFHSLLKVLFLVGKI